MGVFLRYPSPYYASFREIHEKPERLGLQTRSGIEPCTSWAPVLRAEPLGHWWDKIRKTLKNI